VELKPMRRRPGNQPVLSVVVSGWTTVSDRLVTGSKYSALLHDARSSPGQIDAGSQIGGTTRCERTDTAGLSTGVAC
jgi:hypothetical protein